MTIQVDKIQKHIEKTENITVPLVEGIIKHRKTCFEIIVKCPFCNKTHTHGEGEHEEFWRKQSNELQRIDLIRISHCNNNLPYRIQANL